MAKRFSTIDDYISSFPEDVQSILSEIRRRIRNLVPEGEETISYEIPAIKLNGRPLVYFAAWKHHVSLYPLPAVDEAFESELTPYKAGKGTVKFRVGKPVPYEIIERLVGLLVEQRSKSQR